MSESLRAGPDSPDIRAGENANKGISVKKYDELVYRRTFKKHNLSSNAVAVFRLLITERATDDKQQVRMTCKQIADQLGVARKTVNRRKAELMDKGFIGKHSQRFDPKSGKYETTLWDLRPGMTKIGAEYEVSHGIREASIETTADRGTGVEVGVPRLEGGCPTVEGSAQQGIQADRGTGPPWDKKSQVSYDTIQADEGAPPEGVAATPSPPDEEIVSADEWKRLAKQEQINLRKRIEAREGKQQADQSDDELTEGRKVARELLAPLKAQLRDPEAVAAMQARLDQLGEFCRRSLIEKNN